VMLRLSRHPLLLLLGDVPSLAQGRAYAEFSCLAMFFYPSTERDHSQMGYQWLVHSHRLCRVTVRHIRSEPLYFCCTYEGAKAEQDIVWSQTLGATTQRNHWTMHFQIHVFLITFGSCRS